MWGGEECLGERSGRPARRIKGHKERVRRTYCTNIASSRNVVHAHPVPTTFQQSLANGFERPLRPPESGTFTRIRHGAVIFSDANRRNTAADSDDGGQAGFSLVEPPVAVDKDDLGERVGWVVLAELLYK
jgi:hypothetical protein